MMLVLLLLLLLALTLLCRGWWGHDLRGKIEPLLLRLDGGKKLPDEAAYVAAMHRELPV